MLIGCSFPGRTLGNVRSAGCLDVIVSGDMDWGRHISCLSSRSSLGTLFSSLGLGFLP